MKFATLLMLFVCVSGAFGQTNSSFYVSTTGDDKNPAPNPRHGALFNMPQRPRVRVAPSTCVEESTKSW